ncbi:MAG: hypothetical protein JW395_2712 [Nitrospira sp.]|nr:hypothetical protein [Nitrospira sp.]
MVTKAKKSKGKEKSTNTKFMMVPSDGTYLARKLISKDGNQFYLEERVEIKGIVLDEKPNLRKYDPAVGFKFESSSFKNNFKTFKGEYAVFPDGFPAKERKAIEKLINVGIYSYEYDEHGWQLIEECCLVFGDLNIHEVYVNNLVFYTGEINGVSSPLTKADFEQYRDNGMPQNIFDELTDDNDFAGPILSDHSSLTVNDKDVEGFYNRLESLHNQAVVEYDRTHPFESKAQKTGRGKAKKGKKKTSGDSMDLSSYMFVYSAWTKRSFYELEIYEDFDIDRLRVEVSRDELHLGDHPIYTFSLSYETQNGEIVDFSFRENHGTNSDSSCLYDTKGKAFNFEIIEGDDDDEEEE